MLMPNFHGLYNEHTKALYSFVEMSYIIYCAWGYSDDFDMFPISCMRLVIFSFLFIDCKCERLASVCLSVLVLNMKCYVHITGSAFVIVKLAKCE